MKYIYLSPHLDDAVFSCGGMIWEQVRRGFQVEVWTFFTSDPLEPLSPYAQMLHERWQDTQNPYALRREEDIRALSGLGCKWLHLDYPDCIYRRDKKTHEPLINEDADLFREKFVVDENLVGNMQITLSERLSGEFNLCVPLAIGSHIDHRNTRLAAERIGCDLYYFADYPYAANEIHQLNKCLPRNAIELDTRISAPAITAWQDAIACYASQISSFWSLFDEMNKAIADYASLPLAGKFWKTTPTHKRSSHAKTR